MEVFRKLFPKWEPLVCKPQDIVDLIQECLDVDAPLCRLIVENNGVQHKVGGTSDYDNQIGFFDSMFYLDGQEFKTLDDFCRNALMDGMCFMEYETIRILKDKDAGDPRCNLLLEKREMKP